MAQTMQTYNFINSVKGGVGKTTLSVLLAHYMEQMKTFSEEISQFNGEIMLLDFDLQGTAMKKLFYGTGQEPGKYVYLDEIILGREEIDPEIYKNELNKLNELNESVKNSHPVNAIFSNDSMEAKLLYRVGAKNNYSSAISYDFFRRGVWRALEELRDQDYDHFIFDMPPNFDGFASASIEEVCKRKEEQSKMIINMFFVTGMDEGQIMVTLEEVKNMMTHEEHFTFDNLFIVFNDLLRVEGVDDVREVIKDKILFCRESLFRGITGMDIKHIFFVYMPFNNNYAQFNRKGHGLRNLKILIKDDMAISKVLTIAPQTNIWDADGREVGSYSNAEKLLELMLKDKK